MATYKEIAETVKESDTFTPKTCWIARVKSDHGLTIRQAYNRILPAERKCPCPRSKRRAIENALRQHGMI